MPHLVILTSLLTVGLTVGSGRSFIGFDLSNSTIPLAAIHHDVPPPNRMSAVEDPRCAPAHRIGFLDTMDVVAGFSHNGLGRAYPLPMVIWQERVAESVGELPIALVHCPPGAGATVFIRVLTTSKVLDFGVPGLLCKGGVVLLDRPNRFLWKLIGMQAIPSPFVKAKLNWLPTTVTHA